jgi:hypothetical protein
MPPIARFVALALLLAAFNAPAGAAADPQASRPAPARTPASRPAPARPGDPAATPAAKPKPVRNPAFYVAQVPVNSKNEKSAATARGLAQVVVRLSGDPKAASAQVVRRAMGGVEALVVSSEWTQDSETVNGVPVYRTLLTVAFDPDAVDALMAAAGLRYWSSVRPKPILWLVIDDGRGPRLVTGKQTNVVKPLATRGLERGMRFLLPAGTTAEVNSVRSVLGLNALAMSALTARYGNDAQLLGKVYRSGPGWAAEWLLTQGGVEVARWSYSDVDPRRVIASGVDEGANALAARDSTRIDSGVAGVYAIEVDGVDTQGDYLRLMGYLETLAIVRRVGVLEAMPGQMRVQLDLSIGMRGFRTLIAGGNVLRPQGEAAVAEGAPPASGLPRYTLQ